MWASQHCYYAEEKGAGSAHSKSQSGASERRINMAKNFRHIVTVRPKGKLGIPFPVDMLRYDGLHPRSEEDSGKIVQSMGRFGVPPMDEVGNIHLVKDTYKNWTPTIDRWKSFVWRVVSHEIIPGL
jgi:hypothetical protein